MSKESQKTKPTDSDIASHWADNTAEELIALHPSQTRFVCASGISPSGTVHIGNFREVITVDLVVRALGDKKKEVRFLYSWDDYDAFRKVPVNLPNPKLLEENLRRPLSSVPDPFQTKKSYAEHFEKEFEQEISELGILPEFIYQNERYKRGDYLDGILTALKHEGAIKKILERHRTDTLSEDWTCISIFCKKCGRDTTKFLSVSLPAQFKYSCATCKTEEEIDAQKEGGVKLLWRVDWPMRWAKEGVDFEPGGKDHSSQGGSYDTGAEIIRAVWKKEPPHYLQYDFVLIKGAGAKLSSSKGQLITLAQALEVYEPQVVRWIFASRKPNIDFSIAFDLDVLKAYDDFDRCERIAYGAEPAEPKKALYERRIYELSLIKPARIGAIDAPPVQFPFRHLCNVLQIYQGKFENVKEFYKEKLASEKDVERLRSRSERAWRWITEYAPEEFRFQLRNPSDPYQSTLPLAIRDLAELLSIEPSSTSEDELANKIYEIMKKYSLDAKSFFPEIYRVLIGKNSGPKLASFLQAIGFEKAREILERAI